MSRGIFMTSCHVMMNVHLYFSLDIFMKMIMMHLLEMRRWVEVFLVILAELWCMKKYVIFTCVVIWWIRWKLWRVTTLQHMWIFPLNQQLLYTNYHPSLFDKQFLFVDFFVSRLFLWWFFLFIKNLFFCLKLFLISDII